MPTKYTLKSGDTYLSKGGGSKSQKDALVFDSYEKAYEAQVFCKLLLLAESDFETGKTIKIVKIVPKEK